MGFEHDKAVVVYPNYLNAKKSVAEGRRIPRERACDNPQIIEMLDSCVKGLKLSAQVEDKSYSRDWLVRGRIRVQLKDSNGKPVYSDIPTRRVLMIKMAELIPKHPLRRQKAPAAQPQEQAAPTAAPGSTSTTTKKDKKDKKNKRR